MADSKLKLEWEWEWEWDSPAPPPPPPLARGTERGTKKKGKRVKRERENLVGFELWFSCLLIWCLFLLSPTHISKNQQTLLSPSFLPSLYLFLILYTFSFIFSLSLFWLKFSDHLVLDISPAFWTQISWGGFQELIWVCL